MTAQHTPGSWRWWLCKDGSYDSNNDYVQIAGRPDHVAQIRIASVSEADLNLIAAAPDLLDALRQWANAEATNDAEELQNARASRDAAIARATHKEQT